MRRTTVGTKRTLLMDSNVKDGLMTNLIAQVQLMMVCQAITVEVMMGRLRYGVILWILML